MKIMVLGTGMQGKAVLHDLHHSSDVTQVVAADIKAAEAEQYVTRHGLDKVTVVSLDADDEGALRRLVEHERPQALVCMLAPQYGLQVARCAVDCGVHYVSSSYTGELVQLHEAARSAGVSVLPEMGMDPGIDLFLCRLAVNELDEVHGLHSYGAGVPEPACADDNPLRYKISWTFDGVLKAYKRPARLLRDGQEVIIPEGHIFRPEHGHLLEVKGLGLLEAYPNGDAVAYIEKFRLGSKVRDMGRFALRWPGHNALWNAWARLGFLDDTPIDVDGCPVSPRRFMVHHLTPRLVYDETQRDVAVLLARAWGLKDGKRCRVSYWLVDYRDLKTGLFAMNRTVGFTSSIGAQLLVKGVITGRGVLSPARDVSPEAMVKELEKRGMRVESSLEQSWEVSGA